VLTSPHPIAEQEAAPTTAGHASPLTPAVRVVDGSTPACSNAYTDGPSTPATSADAPHAYAHAGLSEREIAVLTAWFAFDTKLVAATHLHIAVGTVHSHVMRIRSKYAKVGRPATTKAALVARALQDGFVTLDDL
jgi:DNA-binding NarL/FixJ family response regulator